MNLKLLRSLPSEWNTNNTNGTHKADDSSHEISTTHTHHNGSNNVCLDNLCDAVICAFLASQPNCSKLSQEDLEQPHPDDLKEMDLQWEMAMLTIRARRFIKRTRKKLNINGQKWNALTVINMGTLPENVATATSFAVESFVNLSDKSRSDKVYHSVPPPLIRNFIPCKPDLTFIDEIVESENLDVITIVTPSNNKTVENKGVSNIVESNAVRMNNTSAPIIED
ncbi:hypothetical protein Tco_1520264 [Tanacetum coccineum]